MTEVEKQVKPVVLRMLAYEEAGVGRIISLSKRKYIWTFDVDNALHSVTFLLSALSKKWVVLFDADEKKSGMQTLIRNLEISFHEIGHYFVIVQNFLNFDMYIDGCLFKPNTTIVLDKRLPPPEELDGPAGRAKCHTAVSVPAKEERKFSVLERIRRSISGKASEIGKSVQDSTKKLLHPKKKDENIADEVQETVQEDAENEGENGEEEEPVPTDRRTSSAPPLGAHTEPLDPPPQPQLGDCDKWLHDIFSESTIAEIDVSRGLEMSRAIVYEGDLEEYAVVDFNGRTKTIDKIVLNCYAAS